MQNLYEISGFVIFTRQFKCDQVVILGIWDLSGFHKFFQQKPDKSGGFFGPLEARGICRVLTFCTRHFQHVQEVGASVMEISGKIIKKTR